MIGKRAALAGLALLVLNSALTLHNVWPTPWVRIPWELSVELAGLVLLLAWLTRNRRALAKTAQRILTAALILLVIGRYLQITSPALFGRPVNLYWDSQHVPNVMAMLIDAYPLWQILIGAVIALVVFALFSAMLGKLLALLVNALITPPLRGLLIIGALSIAALYGAGKFSQSLTTEYWFSIPVSKMYASQLALIFDAFAEQRSQRAMPASVLVDSDLARLDGADVFIVFSESYGATVFDDRGYAATLAPQFGRLEQAAAGRGMPITSAFFESPTFAGLSWLAHSSLLSGIEIRNSGTYRRLLASRRSTLLDLFTKHGYRTLALKPGLKKLWPEGRFYRFDKFYDAKALAYPGPKFGWWAIPDQYSLAYMLARETTQLERPPMLTMMATVATHSPFVPVPPYQENWWRILGSEPFEDAEVRQALARSPNLSDPRADYLDAIAYSLQWLAGFVENHLKTGDVLVMLGDHQPPASVSGKGARWDVPVHIVTDNTDIVAYLEQRGFNPGIAPASKTLAQLHSLGALLLAAMAGGNDRDQPSSQGLANAKVRLSK